jgi:hypothetical protein
MMVPGADVLELHPRGSVELHGVFDVFALFAGQLHVQAGFFEDLAHGCVIWDLAPLHVAAGRDPHSELTVEVQEDFALPHHEDRDCEVPPGMLFVHEDQVTSDRPKLGTASQNAVAEGVASTGERIGGREEIHVPLTPSEAFRRYDETPDEEFYSVPRLVTHIDDRAIAAVTQLYRELFPLGGKTLDLMSSWVSHLPEEVRYERVVGLGMNEEELRRNPRLDDYVVQNLNRDPKLPFADAEFDGVGICVSIDYLTNAVAVLREVGRVLKVRAPVVVTFSNRCFPDKAVAIWHQLDDQGHVRLVEGYLEEAGNFENVRGLDRSPRRIFSDPLYAVIGQSTGPV